VLLRKRLCKAFKVSGLEISNETKVPLTLLLARSRGDIKALKAAVANPLTIFGQREAISYFKLCGAILATDWLDFI
jgi:hypothetical protein